MLRGAHGIISSGHFKPAGDERSHIHHSSSGLLLLMENHPHLKGAIKWEGCHGLSQFKEKHCSVVKAVEPPVVALVPLGTL